MLGAVFLREGHVEDALLAGGGAEKLFLEAGDEAARADGDPAVLIGAALEGLAVDLADIGDGDAVAGLGGAFLRLEVGAVTRELRHLGIDFLVGDLGDRDGRS